MDEANPPQFPFAFLWPALAAQTASEFASAVAREFAQLAIGQETKTTAPQPEWTTPNRVALELPSFCLRDFSTGEEDVATLICAPYALHGATIADFASDHSLVETFQRSGLTRVFVTDWRSASPAMRSVSIDQHVCELNVAVDELGGRLDLVGICQGGWMALIYAARFPAKVRKLVLAGAPIDIAAGSSAFSELARNTPLSVFKELIELGNGCVLGQMLLQFWARSSLDGPEIHHLLQSPETIESPAFARLERRFREWHAWTLNLPGTYYLQVVEQLFKENQLPAGRFTVLGRRLPLANVTCPLFLLAGRDDEIVAPEQLFATEHLVGSQPRAIEKTMAPCDHLGLFMGREILLQNWSEIARWLRASQRTQQRKRA